VSLTVKDIDAFCASADSVESKKEENTIGGAELLTINTAGTKYLPKQKD
jgi:hypothetical protein